MPDSVSSWSPADNPYAIAVSEAQLWLQCVLLSSCRVKDADDLRSGFSSRQIDARQLVVALWQLLMAEKLQQVALRALNIDRTVFAELGRARSRFEEALPGIKHMRDALMHFDEWARGEGGGPQTKDVRAGVALREVARMYWGFVYTPEKNTITLGPYVVDVEAASSAARALADAIYQAARAVDQRTVAELRTRAVNAITDAGLSCDSPAGVVKVSLGRDARVWVSLDIAASGLDLGIVSARVATALVDADLQPVALDDQPDRTVAERLVAGEALCLASAEFGGHRLE